MKTLAKQSHDGCLISPSMQRFWNGNFHFKGQGSCSLLLVAPNGEVKTECGLGLGFKLFN